MITDFTTYHREYYYKRRQMLFDYMGQYACVKCGSADNLHIDHKEPHKKAFSISSNLTLNEQTKRELDKCQVLCETCHYVKTAEENKNKGEHGAYRKYFKGKCRCSACVSWHKTYTYGRVLKRQRERTQNP